MLKNSPEIYHIFLLFTRIVLCDFLVGFLLYLWAIKYFLSLKSWKEKKVCTSSLHSKIGSKRLFEGWFSFADGCELGKEAEEREEEQDEEEEDEEEEKEEE